MKWHKALLVVLMLSFTVPAAAEEVKLLAYNVYLRPDPVGWFDYKAERFAELSEAVRSYDVVGLCEVFDNKLRKEWTELLSDTHPHVIQPPKRQQGRHVVNGGIMIFSRYPIVFQEKIIYRQANNWDYFSDKGAIFARIELPSGKQFEVVLTHAQAGKDYHVERKTQLEQMQELVAKNSTGPTFLMGDFNVNDALDEYNVMMNIFQHPRDLFRTLHKSPGYTSNGDENPLSGGKPKRIDYIFMNDPNNQARIKKCLVNKFPMQNPVEDAKFMSDHYAVEATVEIVDPAQSLDYPQVNMVTCDKGDNKFVDSPADMDLSNLQSNFDPQLDTIVMVHGFFNTFDSAKESYTAINKVMQTKTGKYNYVGFSWPCNIVLDFGKGVNHANKAGEYLTHLLTEISGWYGSDERRVHVMSSSLGNRVTFSALKQNSSRFIKWGQCFNFCPGVHQDVYLNEFKDTNSIPQKNWIFFAKNDFVLGYLYAAYYWLFGRDGEIPQDWQQLNGEERIAKMRELWQNRNSRNLNDFEQQVVAAIERAQKNAMGLVGADLGQSTVKNVVNIEVTDMVETHSYWKNPKVLNIVVNKLQSK